MNCLSDETVVEFLAHRLPDEGSERAETHIDGCADCRRLVAILARSAAARPTPAHMEAQALAPTLEDGGGSLAGERSAAGHLSRGEAVSRYLVLAPLGVGGMGIVYQACDPDLNRKVALKLVRPDARGTGGDGVEPRDRLLREARAAAGIAHPNVVAVHDVGVHDGQVFIAMEYVDGLTLAEWLRERPRSRRETLDAIAAVGRGVAAAHDAGLLHRDLKPANVMVGRDGRVRVMDFGLARAINRDGSEPQHSARGIRSPIDVPPTQTGSAAGTPRYMAPEQLLGESADARSDQFSFCVTAYEALYGEHPFAEGGLKETTSAIVAGRVKEPPRGTRVPPWLRRVLLRGLSANPDERHGSVAELISRLTNDPGLVWRRRAVGALVALALATTGTFTYRHLAGDEPDACGGARQKLAGIWDSSRQEAVQQRILAARTPLSEAAWTGVSRGLDQYAQEWVSMHTETCQATRVRGEQSEALLDLRMQCLERRRQELRALVEVLAETDAQGVWQAVQAAQSLPPLASCQDSEALLAPLKLPGDPSLRQAVASARDRLARADALRATGKHADARKMVESVLAELRDTGYRPLEAETLLLLGEIQATLGDNVAEHTLRRAARVADIARHDRVRAQAAADLVLSLGAVETKYGEAQDWAEYASSVIARIGGDGELRADLAEYTGAMLHERGQFEKAYEQLRIALDLREKVLGAGHPLVAVALGRLGRTLLELGRTSEALGALQRALVVQTQAFGPSHPAVGYSHSGLGRALRSLGRPAEAIEHFQLALGIMEPLFGAEHPGIAAIRTNMANAYADQGEHENALELYQRSLAVTRKRHGEAHPDVGRMLLNLGATLADLKRYREAREHIARAHALLEAALGANAPVVATAVHALGDLELAQGRYQQALAAYQQALAARQEALGPSHPEVSMSRAAVGSSHVRLKRFAPAIPILERALRDQEKHEEPEPVLARTRLSLAQALWGAGRDRVRARLLAEKAREEFARAGRGAEGDLVEVESWLARTRKR